MSPPPFALHCRQVIKSFGNVHALAGLNLEIPKGQLYTLLGPNGAGKTTALRVIAGLSRPNHGDIELFGKPLASDPTDIKRRLAYLPDEPLLYGKLRPMEYFEYIAGLWSLPANRVRSSAEALLTEFELWDRRDDYIETFSRGMMQKVAMIGAIIRDPELFLLDEPLTGLDAMSARQVKDWMRAFVSRGGSIVMTTHILEVAERMADRIGIIREGRIIAEGTLAQLTEMLGMVGANLEEVFFRLAKNCESRSR